MWHIIIDGKVYLTCDSREAAEMNLKGLLAPATQQRAQIIHHDALTISMSTKAQALKVCDGCGREFKELETVKGDEPTDHGNEWRLCHDCKGE